MAQIAIQERPKLKVDIADAFIIYALAEKTTTLRVEWKAKPYRKFSAITFSEGEGVDLPYIMSAFQDKLDGEGNGIRAKELTYKYVEQFHYSNAPMDYDIV